MEPTTRAEYDARRADEDRATIEAERLAQTRRELTAPAARHNPDPVELRPYWYACAKCGRTLGNGRQHVPTSPEMIAQNLAEIAAQLAPAELEPYRISWDDLHDSRLLAHDRFTLANPRQSHDYQPAPGRCAGCPDPAAPAELADL